MRVRSILAAAGAAALATTLAGTPAQAAAEPLVQGLAGPLSLSVDRGKIYVTQSFGGKLSRYDLDGSGGKTLYQRNPKIEIAGVDAAGPGAHFALTGKNRDGKLFARLMHRAADGTVTRRADLLGFERSFNPDGHRTYGFRDISDSCADRIPKSFGPPSPKAIVESHPYATALMGNGTVAVADAAGNDIVTVSRSGFRTEIATLPAQPLRITKARAGQFDLPACTVGERYWFEPVPTDVEVHNGKLYVSVLPGGPEDPSLGARGRVYRVDPDNGDMKVIGRGFAAATGLAVTPKGKVYVAELFGGAVSTIKDGWAHKVFSVATPSAIEWYKGRLYVTADTFANGSIVKLNP